MVAYLLIFLFCSFGFLFEKFNKKYADFLFILIFIYLLILIGLKFEIGGDWINYLNIYSNINQKIFNSYGNENYDIFFKTEPVMILLFLLSPNIFVFNLICALIFLIGLFTLISKFQDRFLALVISVPFLIILVAMGYQKQSVAIGLIMLVYYFYLNNNYKTFVFFCFVTIFSHYSSFFLIIFIFYDLIFFKKFRISLLQLFLILFFVIIFLLFSNDYVFRIIINNYLFDENKLESQGLIPRLIVQFISIFLYLISYKLWKRNEILNRIIIFNIILTFMITPFATLFSTSIDRMLFYFMVLQLMVLANYNEIISLNKYIFLDLQFLFFIYL